MLISLISFAQSKLVQDTIESNISVMFNKLKYSNNTACRCELQVRYLPLSRSVLLYFEVPNYDLRFKTTLNDYAILKFDNIQFKFANKVESLYNERFNHIFVLELSNEKWKVFLTHHLKSITFFFEPNEEFILKSLATYKGFGSDKTLKNTYVKLANKTVTSTCSKPDKKQYNDLIQWLYNL